MKLLRIFSFAICVASVLLPREMRAAPTPAERVSDIQKALRDAKLDGWLFYDFRGSDPLALRILKLDEHAVGSRRWFYFIPANGECTKIVHRIEAAKLDALPGKRVEYSSWKEQHEALRSTLLAGNKKPRIAMQYSPMNDIPYMSRVDAGTIELIRSLGADIVTSAEFVQQFEAVWSPEQLQSHIEASDKMHRIFFDAFGEIARRINANEATTEYDIEQFILRRWQEENMGGEHADAIVSVNANTANPHYVPTREKALPIKRGDFVLMDLASKLRQPGAVATDQTWTGYVGETVPEEYTKIFNIVRDARDAAVDFVRTNVRAGEQIRGADVDDVSRGVITRAGYGEYFTHRTGHSIGEEVHGNGVNIDNFETRDSRRITPGVCFSIEPGIYLPNKFGVRSEIDVYVRENDIEVTGQPIQTEVVPILALPKMIGTVDSLWRYPVKSMRGEELAEAFIGFGGVEGDRRFAFHSSAAPLDFPFFTARQQTQMLRYRPRLRADKHSMEVETPSGKTLAIDDPALIDELRTGADPKHEVTLVRFNRSQADGHAVSLMSLQTVQQLANEAGLPAEKRRYRESIYLDLPNTSGFGEDEFVGRSLRIGNDVVVAVVERDQRCMMTNLDPDTAAASPAMLKMIAQKHGGNAGVYGEVLREGVVKKGDALELLRA